MPFGAATGVDDLSLAAAHVDDFAASAGALAARFGRGGSFWRGNGREHGAALDVD